MSEGEWREGSHVDRVVRGDPESREVQKSLTDRSPLVDHSDPGFRCPIHDSNVGEWFRHRNGVRTGNTSEGKGIPWTTTSKDNREKLLEFLRKGFEGRKITVGKGTRK